MFFQYLKLIYSRIKFGLVQIYMTRIREIVLMGEGVILRYIGQYLIKGCMIRVRL